MSAPLPPLPSAIRLERTDFHDAWFWRNRDLPKDMKTIGIQSVCAALFLAAGLFGLIQFEFSRSPGAGILFGCLLIGVVVAGVICSFGVSRLLGSEFFYFDRASFGWGLRVGRWERKTRIPIDAIARIENARVVNGEGEPEAFETLNLYYRKPETRTPTRVQLAPTLHPAVRAALAEHLGEALERWCEAASLPKIDTDRPDSPSE